jgi:HAD superfamily hydrolase (TIGR01490 family)
MIHIFDVDDTVIKKTSMWYFLLEAFQNRLVRFSQIRRLPVDWVKYKLGFPDMDFIENTVKKIAGIDREMFEKTADDCFEKRIKAKIYKDAARLIREAQGRGEKVIFATSSIDIVIRPLEKFFNIEGSLATELEYSGGKTTGRLAGVSFFGAKKKDAALEWLGRNNINAADVSFYSDSYTDIPLLQACGRPVAVNPDHILYREAKKREWEILRFSEVLGA